MDAMDAATRCQRMWARLGKAFEREAYARAKTQNGHDRVQAVLAAKTAEACFWQATGHADCFDFERGPVNG